MERKTVILLTAKYIHGGCVPGMVGRVVENYGDGRYEVQFADSRGVTVAQMVVREHDIMSVPEAND